MKILNLNDKLLTTGWTVTRLSPKIQPVIPGLAGCFFVKATFQLQPGGVAVPCEGRPEFPSGDRPLHGKSELGLAYASDFVPYKPHGEFMVIGTARCPSPGMVAFSVGAKVGELSKRVLVVGPRTWKRTLLGAIPGDPGPCPDLPLTYANSWGGKDYPRNPIGKGWDTDALPQFENPDAPIESKKSSVEPAGFGPLAPAWVQRASKMGTFDKEWIAERWPWWPLDLDWSYFQSAPMGQWFPSYLRGDEEMEFENLHAGHAIYRSRLPGLRARAFLEEEQNGTQDFREVALDLDTVWADLDEEKLILVWRGRTPVRSLKLKELKNLFVLAEPLQEPPHPNSHYYDLMQGVIAAKLPKKPAPPKPTVDVDAVIAATTARFAEQFKTLENLDSIAAQHEQEALSQAEALGMKIPKFGEAPSVEESVASMQKLLSEREAMTTPGSAEIASALGRAQSDVKELLAFPEEMMKKFGSEMEAIKARRKASSEGGSPIDPSVAKIEGLANQRFEGQDFSSLDLEGVDFSGGTFKSCRFVGTKLKGAKFLKANLSLCDLSGAGLQEANFGGANFDGCQFVGAHWKGAILDGTKMPEAALAGVDFSGVSAKNSRMPGANPSKANCVEADFCGANLEKADLGHSDFSMAKLTGSRFAGVQAQGAKFCDAEMTGFRAPRNANFTGADLRRVRADASIWKGSILNGANLQQGEFRRAQFSEISAVETCFDRCEMAGCTFEDAVMSRAILTNANLLRCVFNRADLESADLSGSNLFDSGLWDTNLLHAKWPGANIKKTRLAF